MDCYPEAPERAGMIRPGGVASRILQGCNRALFRRLDHLVCLDTAMADLLLSRYRPRGRALAVSIIPNWEDAEFFPADARHPAWDGLEHHGLTGRFVVLYLGNMGVGHEFDTVLDAAGMLADEPRVVFLFIGGGARRETVSAEASRRGLSNVLVQGYVPKSQTPSVMAGVSCSLITLRDSMLGVMSPSKLHSNLAMGLPVLYVGPRTSNVDDAIARFGCGVSLGVGDARGLAEAVRRLVRDEGLQRSMRAAARRAFDEAYNDRAAHAEFDAVLGQVAPGAAS
jgi:glycosyltransferase involved in cell wall biosynthesis